MLAWHVELRLTTAASSPSSRAARRRTSGRDPANSIRSHSPAPYRAARNSSPTGRTSRRGSPTGAAAIPSLTQLELRPLAGRIVHELGVQGAHVVADARSVLAQLPQGHTLDAHEPGEVLRDLIVETHLALVHQRQEHGAGHRHRVLRDAEGHVGRDRNRSLGRRRAETRRPSSPPTAPTHRRRHRMRPTASSHPSRHRRACRACRSAIRPAPAPGAGDPCSRTACRRSARGRRCSPERRR